MKYLFLIKLKLNTWPEFNSRPYLGSLSAAIFSMREFPSDYQPLLDFKRLPDGIPMDFENNLKFVK